MAWQSVLVILAATVSLAAPGFAAATDCANDVADQQGVTAYTSLIDGQPTSPRKPTFGAVMQTGFPASTLQLGVLFAPGTRRGLCDAVLSLTLPAVQWPSAVRVSDAFGVSWEQRWHADDRRLPTLATLFSAQLDRSNPGELRAAQWLVVAAKIHRDVVYYANVFANGASARTRSALTWTPGALVGIKRALDADRAWIADVVWKEGAPAALELAYQFSGPGDSDLGVGLAWSPGSEQPASIGLTWQWEP